jgi:hypothetical protein
VEVASQPWIWMQCLGFSWQSWHKVREELSRLPFDIVDLHLSPWEHRLIFFSWPSPHRLLLLIPSSLI